MKIALGVLTAMALMGTGLRAGQAPDAHVALAKSAAGDAYRNLFNYTVSRIRIPTIMAVRSSFRMTQELKASSRAVEDARRYQVLSPENEGPL